MKMTPALFVALCSVVFLASAASAQVTKGVAKLSTTSFGTDLNIAGYVTFTLSADGNVTVEANITGELGSQAYAMHVHQYGDLTNKTTGSSAGTHFAGAGSATHGCPPSLERHEGDMGNWTAVSGVIQMSKTLDLLQLTDINSIIGRAVVLHAGEDDCGQPTGHAGNFLAVGVIGIPNVAGNAATNGDTTAKSAVVVLEPTANCNESCSGTVWITVEDEGVRVVAEVAGLELNSKHGFHIHTYGDLSSTDGSSVGSHWNPTGAKHHVPETTPRHVGDLGNIQSYDSATGLAHFNYTTTNIPDVHSLLGRAVAIHSGKDHGSGYGCDQAGTSGKRIMVGVIGLAHPSTVPSPVPIAVDNTFANEDCTARPSSAHSLTAPLAALLGYLRA